MDRDEAERAVQLHVQPSLLRHRHRRQVHADRRDRCCLEPGREEASQHSLPGLSHVQLFGTDGAEVTVALRIPADRRQPEQFPVRKQVVISPDRECWECQPHVRHG
jgi:hypothetical protein